MNEKNQKSNSFSVAVFFLTVILIIQVFLVLYPLAFTISASFSESNSLASTSIVPFKQKISLFQYTRLFTQTNYFHWYMNTLIIATSNTIITVVVCSLCGYIFSRFSFPFKKPVMASMIILQMFPSFIGMIATYVILWKLNALNTLWGLVLVYSTGSIPFNSWLMKGYFDTVPRDIAEAAYIDGATPLGAFLKVVVPAAKPQIVFLALTSFTGPWMDFIFPRLVLRTDSKKTLAVGLFEMINGRAADHFTMFAAGALLVAIPFTILFVLGQKSLLQSLAGTGGKE
ncbi:MAG: sugar ABC transporter permease [Spirochaetales bacterium]|nr:sugar ABC transporter permease [Spirochaetales bacterium]